ncbi:MAG: lipoprotein signal peptidase [Chitinophagales bacterium]|nr:lipoprotein signal peptidase [Chitinophagales bacterium]
MNKKAIISIATVLILLGLDQYTKIWVKTNMLLGDEIPIFGNSILLHFTENAGMAFGLEWGGPIGKYFLSTFRIVFSGVIIYYIIQLVKKNAHTGFIVASSMILAGAVGNLIDCMFYGLIFTESGDFIHQHIATFVPFGTGYAAFLQGRVVDMIWCPIIRTTYPDWFPVYGGQPFVFFTFIFNIADSAISVGVAIVFLFQKTFFEGLDTFKEPELIAAEEGISTAEETAPQA